MKKFGSVIVVMLVIALLGMGGYFAWKAFFPTQEEIESSGKSRCKFFQARKLEQLANF